MSFYPVAEFCAAAFACLPRLTCLLCVIQWGTLVPVTAALYQSHCRAFGWRQHDELW
jgi:hypothetical protein